MNSRIEVYSNQPAEGEVSPLLACGEVSPLWGGWGGRTVTSKKRNCKLVTGYSERSEV